MGFHTGAYATVWEVEPKSDTSTKVRMSISRKNKATSEYEQDFSGFVMAVGTAAASKAAHLNKGDKIKLGDVDVTTRYDKERKITYTNYKLFSFTLDGDSDSAPKSSNSTPSAKPAVDDGEIEDGRKLPF